jgi:hypothetical protein
MKHPKAASTKPDDGLHVELGRLRAMHHVHDAARILTDATPYVSQTAALSTPQSLLDSPTWNVTSPIY